MEIVENSIRKHWDLPAFSDHRGETFLYSDVARKIARMHIVMEEANIRKGDKVALVGRNSAQWAISFYGILSYGAVVVPILHEFKPDNIHNIVNHSEARFMLAGDSNWKHLDAGAMPGVDLFMKLENFAVIQAKDPRIHDVLQKLDELFAAKYPGGFDRNSVTYHSEQPDELAVINYTSGTTGFSKGVMIPFRSLWSNTLYARENIPFVKAGDNFVCMLPMAHMYGLAFEILNGLGKGCHVHFLPRIPSPNIILEAFGAHKPSLILAVPLIIEKIIRNKVFPEIRKPLISILLKLPIVKSIILKSIATKLNTTFGEKFGEIVIGGAAINKEVEQFLHRIKFRYTVGYGLTECGPLVAYAQWDQFKPGSVGRIVDRMEVDIRNKNDEGTGEIWVKGSNNMLGYYKNPEATAAIMTADGWMNTGDLGVLDPDGFLYIKGRSKTMILSSNGQNIYPEEIESLLNTLPLVVESLIITEHGKLTALVYPDREKESSEEEIMKKMDENIAGLNAVLPVYCQISTCKLQPEEFEKTPKKSIKRYLYQQ